MSQSALLEITTVFQIVEEEKKNNKYGIGLEIARHHSFSSWISSVGIGFGTQWRATTTKKQTKRTCLFIFLIEKTTLLCPLTGCYGVFAGLHRRPISVRSRWANATILFFLFQAITIVHMFLLCRRRRCRIN